MKIYRTIQVYLNRRCKIDDLINFYLNNPPIKIDLTIPVNLTSYTNILNKTKDLTLVEISQYEPIYSEIVIETKKTDTIISLKEIHDKIMNVILIENIEKLKFIDLLYNRIIDLSDKPFMENLVEKVLAYEITNLYTKYFGINKNKIIYENEYIKLEPNSKYYVLFTRYIEDCELNEKLLGIFNKIFEINLILNLYNSHLFFVSDYSVKSVSISGLSVSFNTPDAESSISRLNTLKQSILENLAEDLPERF